MNRKEIEPAYGLLSWLSLLAEYPKNKGPGTWDLGPGTWDLGPGTSDLGLGTWDLD